MSTTKVLYRPDWQALRIMGKRSNMNMNMNMKIHNLAAFVVVAASVVLLGAVGSARAADQWFVMG